jgi:hypothetical protein
LSILVAIGGLWLRESSRSKRPTSSDDQIDRPFSDASPWNRRIPPQPVVDARSEAIVEYLSTGPQPSLFANLYKFGVPIFEAYPSTQTYSVECTRPWGTCDLEKEPVPIPREARLTRGSDRTMVILDARKQKSYEFRGAVKRGGQWETAWGWISHTDADGYDPHGSGATDGGVPRVAGVVTTEEIFRGYIPHALVFSTDNACRGKSRYPTHGRVGHSPRQDCIPLGARIQLDPTINLHAIPDLTEGERTVARALQEYGAYGVENGGARMAFMFESPIGESDPYPAVGFAYDYYDMPHIPWNKMRVLQRWDGT